MTALDFDLELVAVQKAPEKNIIADSGAKVIQYERRLARVAIKPGLTRLVRRSVYDVVVLAAGQSIDGVVGLANARVPVEHNDLDLDCLPVRRLLRVDKTELKSSSMSVDSPE